MKRSARKTRCWIGALGLFFHAFHPAQGLQRRVQLSPFISLMASLEHLCFGTGDLVAISLIGRHNKALSLASNGDQSEAKWEGQKPCSQNSRS